MSIFRLRNVVSAGLLVCVGGSALAADTAPSYTRDIKGILSNRCVRCHGPDPEGRSGGGDEGLRLDTSAGATADLGGHAAIVPGKPDESELIARITSTDPDLVMPPPEAGQPLSEKQVELLKRWIAAGATYERHWAYVPPKRPSLPTVKNTAWPRNDIDRFILARLEAEGLAPQPEADRATLARRLALDLTGLPLSPEEIDAFVADRSPDAVEKLVDRLLAHDGYGEHQARQWLDLARYADSAGYADDPHRTIWGWRDWVVKAFDANMPFDEFTLKQLAGDLLPEATLDDRIATAFHRNTLTNNEGGTIDEEFRTVAVIDRVNTTLSTWMGTTMACAQCHDHKYDPLSQREYFQLYAILNNTADADRGDEFPLVSFFTPSQEAEKARLEADRAAAEVVLATDTPEIRAARDAWDAAFPRDLKWQPIKPLAATATAAAAAAQAPPAAAPAAIADDGSVRFADVGPQADARIVAAIPAGPLAAVRLEFPGDAALSPGGSGRGPRGKFVISGVSARLEPEQAVATPAGRFLRVELPGPNRILSLAEVEVYSNRVNVARGKAATQRSTAEGGAAARAVDGKTDGTYEANSVTHSATEADPWWEVDLGAVVPVERVAIWNRTDRGLGSRLAVARLVLLDEARKPVWEKVLESAPAPSVDLALDSACEIPLTIAFADREQAGHAAMSLLRPAAAPADAKAVAAEKESGWMPQGKGPSVVTLATAEPFAVPEGMRLVIELRQRSKKDRHTVASVRVSTTADPRIKEWSALPGDVAAIVAKATASRTDAERVRLGDYFRRTVASETAEARARKAELDKSLAGIKPSTVPVLQELQGDKRRVTKIQLRGNWQNLGDEVTEGVPAAFNPAPVAEGQRVDRVALAKWLVDPANPLTARVVVNRIWERLFGIGIVSTSEEFGSQGELPSHPELLDWLATELVARKWDTKAIQRLIVTSAAYRQTSKCPPDLVARDPENRLIACGPRVRLPAEVIRDQALAAAGLLSRKKGGPSVNPPQPNLGLAAAFGGGIDWQTSTGDDRYRRALYTTWRRSNPYPSMATFDAPSREVCTVRRPRTNTPLQALVTMNDPAYVEAAQALAQRMIREGGSTAVDRASRGFRLVLSRQPTAAEIDRLVTLHGEALAEYAAAPDDAKKMATDPLGPPPADVQADMADLAAWTVVANVILNLDEAFMCP